VDIPSALRVAEGWAAYSGSRSPELPMCIRGVLGAKHPQAASAPGGPVARDVTYCSIRAFGLCRALCYGIRTKQYHFGMRRRFHRTGGTLSTVAHISRWWEVMLEGCIRIECSPSPLPPPPLHPPSS